MARKKIKKFSVAELPPATGSISDTLNVEDKIKNAPSINLVEQMTGIPQDGIIAFDGTEIPEGYEEVGNPNSYSTTEVKTDKTWIDGKPIYRKVLDIGNLPNATAKSIAHNISNLSYFIDMYAVAFNNTDFINIPYCHTTAGSSVYLYADATNLNIRAGTDRSGFTGYAILEYTKTTD